MSGLFDQVVNYSPPLLTSGQVNYDGTWNAATNTPTLVSPPDALSKGDYYVVSAAGTQFGISFAVGDWIISNGTAWEKVDLTDAVSSVFGRTGAVVGDSTDYSAVGLTNTAIGAANPSTGAFTSLSSSSTTTLNGTTIPASKTLVVTTDKLSALAATTSAELAGVISDETGSGSLVFANSPTLVSPALGTPSALVGTNITGTAAAFNINGTVGATTPSTVAATSVTALSNSGYQAVVGQLTSGDRVGISGQSSGSGTALVFFDNAQTTFRPAIFDASSHSLKISGVEKASVTSTGLQGAIGATTPSTGAFTSLSSTNGAFNGTVGATTRSTVAATTGNFQAGGGAPIILTGNSSAQIQLGGTGATDPSIRYDAAGVLGVVTADQSAYAKIRALDFNGTIGATTPSTGAFTTLSATGITLSTGDFVGNSGTQILGDNGTVGAPFFSFDGDSDTGAYRPTANRFGIAAGGSLIGDFSSTGLAVTGALSATGNLTLSATNSNILGGTSTGSSSIFNSTGDSGFTIYGPTHATKANQIDVFAGGLGHTFNSTGLAVTGALSATGAISGQDLRQANDGFLTYDSGNVGSKSLTVRDGAGNTRAVFSSTGLAVTGALSSTTGANFATSSGDVVIGNATAAAKLHIQADFSSSYGATVRTTSNASNANLIQFVKDAAGSPNEVGNITYTNATNLTNYNTTSDARLKDNVRELTNSGNIIDGLRPVLHDWKTGQKNIIGFIAQEVFAVFPQAVSKGDDDLETVTQQWSMDASKLVPVLVAELKSLRARLAALESK